MFNYLNLNRLHLDSTRPVRAIYNGVLRFEIDTGSQYGISNKYFAPIRSSVFRPHDASDSSWQVTVNIESAKDRRDEILLNLNLVSCEVGKQNASFKFSVWDRYNGILHLTKELPVRQYNVRGDDSSYVMRCITSEEWDNLDRPISDAAYCVIFQMEITFWDETPITSSPKTDLGRTTQQETTDFNEGKYRNLSANLRALLEEQSPLSDVVLRSGEKEFPVHKCILAARSSVFNSMLLEKNKEDNYIDIPDVDLPELEAMICYMYTDEICELSLNLALGLLSLSMKYQLYDLRWICKRFLDDMCQ